MQISEDCSVRPDMVQEHVKVWDMSREGRLCRTKKNREYKTDERFGKCDPNMCKQRLDLSALKKSYQISTD